MQKKLSDVNETTIPKSPRILWRRNGGKDIVLNLTLKEALIRFIILIFLPILALMIDKRMVVYTTPVMVCLFFSAMVRFSLVKYLWQHFMKHKEMTLIKPYGKDLNYPEESV